MGNLHSTNRRRKARSHVEAFNKKHSTTIVSRPELYKKSSLLSTTPPLSSTSSLASDLYINSRPASVVEEVKDRVQRIARRSSSVFNRKERKLGSGNNALDRCKAPPRRSFSAPSGLSFSTLTDDNHKSTTINGRKYQTLNDKYCLPIDEEEQDRLTNTHFVLKHCFGGNFSAPVHDLLSKSISVGRDSVLLTPSSTMTAPQFPFTFENHSTGSTTPSSVISSSVSSFTNLCWANKSTPARALDVACGSGVWVLEMATNFPNTQFYGVDFVPSYPNTIKPPNADFFQADILSPTGLPFPDEYFDYVHMRLVYNCFSSEDMKFVMNEINRVVKPGGYVEFRDLDPVIQNLGPTSKIFSNFAARMSQLHSVDITWTSKMSEILSSLGEFTDIHHQVVPVGFGKDGPLASSVDHSAADTIRSYRQFLIDAYSITKEECEKIIEKIIEESAVHHSYFNYYMGWGRKPLIDEALLDSPMPQSTADSVRDSLISFARSTSAISLLANGSLIDYGVCDHSISFTCCQNSISETHDSEITEKAHDIVHFASGFTE